MSHPWLPQEMCSDKWSMCCVFRVKRRSTCFICRCHLYAREWAHLLSIRVTHLLFIRVKVSFDVSAHIITGDTRHQRHKTPKTQDTWRIDRQGWGRQQRMSLRFLCLGRLSVCMSLWTCLSLSLRDKTCLHHNCFNNRFRSWKLLCLLSFLVCFLSSFGCLIRLFVRLFWSFGRAARAHLVTLALTHNSASQLFLCPQLDLIFSLISDLFSRFFPLETVNFTARDS